MKPVEGPGIHGGRHARVWLHRDGGPLRFRSGGQLIEANLANVVSTARTTSLGCNGQKVDLVEHLLAALRIKGFYAEVLVEVDGSELPILDGSAEPWLEAIEALGAPPPPPPPLRLGSEVSVAAGLSSATARPGPARLSCRIEFDHPAIGVQHWLGDEPDFPQLLGARTFGFMAELANLHDRGLALGAGLAHAIVFADGGPLSPLRSPDEPVRHKALDALGDLSLLGRPVAADISLVRGSHGLHVALARAITSLETPGPAGAAS